MSKAAILAFLASPLVVSAAIPQTAEPPVDPRRINAGDPPLKYMGGNEVRVWFVSFDQLQEKCPPPDKDHITLGCTATERETKRRVVILVNPCAARDEPYAQIACHELGHWNGWNGTHDN